MNDIDQAIEAREADLSRIGAELDALRTARKILARLVPPSAVGPGPAVPEQAPAPPAKVEPPSQDGEPPRRRSKKGKPQGGPRGEVLRARRLALARQLADRQRRLSELSRAVGAPVNTVLRNLDHEWFSKVSAGVYALSGAGRAALANHGVKEASAEPARQEADRLAIARVIARDGPQTAGHLAGVTGLTHDVVYKALKCPWFKARGNDGLWHLTPAGRAALNGDAPPPAPAATVDVKADRLRIARHIREDGPLSAADLQTELDLSSAEFWPLIRCEWFTVNGGKYSLTAEGESALRQESDS